MSQHAVELAQGARQLGVALSEQQQEKLLGYMALLNKWKVQAEKAAQEEQDDDDDEEPVRELTDLEKAEQKAEAAQALADRLQEQLTEAVSN